MVIFVDNVYLNLKLYGKIVKLKIFVVFESNFFLNFKVNLLFMLGN